MKWSLALLGALLPFVAQSAWIDPTGKLIPDTERMRSAGDFGVQIFLTADEGQFRQTWNSSKTPPKLSTTNTVMSPVSCLANTFNLTISNIRLLPG